jgi:hypothetical protein
VRNGLNNGSEGLERASPATLVLVLAEKGKEVFFVTVELFLEECVQPFSSSNRNFDFGPHWVSWAFQLRPVLVPNGLNLAGFYLCNHLTQTMHPCECLNVQAASSMHASLYNNLLLEFTWGCVTIEL